MFYQELSEYLREHDLPKANRVIMNELARILVSKREDFIYVLQNAGLKADKEMTDKELIDLFINNIHGNKKLMLGAAFVISHNNRKQSFDGEMEHNEEGFKATRKVLYNYFDADHYDNFSSEETSELGGGIGAAIGEVAKLGGGILENQRAKKFGATDLYNKKQEAKSQMVQQVLAQRQAQIIAAQKKKEQSAKTTRVIVIATVSVLVVGIAAVAFYMYKKGKK